MPGTANGSGQWIEVGDQKHELIYSMLSLEKIETQFGSVAEMQAVITDDQGQVRLDKPVVRLLIDILHAGLLHSFADNDEGRRAIASALRPAQLGDIVDAFTAAFTDAFGELGEAALAEGGESVTPPLRPVMNRAERRMASPGPSGITSPPSSSKGRKASGKK